MITSNSDSKNIIVEEHFWFTAITLAFNAFILDKMKDKLDNSLLLTAALIINIYAMFLILHRAAAHADRLKYPKWIEKIKEHDKKFYHKGVETLFHIWISIKMIPIVIFELSGAFFYLLLVIFSFLGIFLIN
jgi:hypothetical protein